MIFYTAIDELGRKHLVGTQADARAINKQFEQIDIPTDKAGLMAYVQDLMDQVGASEAPAAVSVPVQAPAPPSYAHYSVKLDEEFEKLPIAHQLHFAAMAMENARSLVTPPNTAEPADA